jgi:adenylate cyclase
MRSVTIENERRFLLDRLPEGDAVDRTTIRQAYWRLGSGWSFRVRREGASNEDTRNSITIKGPKAGFSRPELDLFLPGDADTTSAVESLFLAAASYKIVKTRYSYILDGLTWDIDQFHWENEGLIIAEIELEDSRELAGVSTPSWAIREVTSDSQYANENLAFQPYRRW